MRRLRPGSQRASRAVSAAYYVGYVDDEEPVEMVMRKFAELEKLEAAAKAQQDVGAEAVQVSEEGCLPEAMLEALFKNTSLVSLRMLASQGVKSYAEQGLDEEEDLLLQLDDEGPDVADDVSEGIPDAMDAMEDYDDDEAPAPPRKRQHTASGRRATAADSSRLPPSPAEEDEGPGRGAAALAGQSTERKCRLTPARRVQLLAEYFQAEGQRSGRPLEFPAVTSRLLRRLGSSRLELLPTMYTASRQPLYHWRPRWHHLVEYGVRRVRKVSALPRAECEPFQPAHLSNDSGRDVPGAGAASSSSSSSPLAAMEEKYSPQPHGYERIEGDIMHMDFTPFTTLSRAIVARGKPKDVPLPVWRKLPNVFLSFVGALVCPPPEVDLPDLIGQFPWTSLIPHGFLFFWCATETSLARTVRAIREAGLRHCDTLIQLHHDYESRAVPFMCVERLRKFGVERANRYQALLIARTVNRELPALQLMHQRNPDVVVCNAAPDPLHPTSPQVYHTIEVLLPHGRLCELWGSPANRRPRWTAFVPPARPAPRKAPPK